MQMKSWKTTVFGAVTACGVALANADDPNLKLIGQVLAVIGPVLFGLFAKDSNVTGGTVATGSTATSITTSEPCTEEKTVTTVTKQQ